MVVKKLRPEASVSVDRERLDQLYVQLGTSGADGVVSRAMEELAVRLARVEKCHRAGDFDELQRAARSMIAISDQIGMTTFATVAKDVSELSLTDDGTALAATVERLTRIGENSLLAIWDLQGASI